MNKTATYAIGFVMGLSSSALTQTVVADTFALSTSQLDSITAGSSLTEAMATAYAAGHLAQTTTSTNATTAAFGSNQEGGSVTVFQQTSGLAIALGSESRSTEVSSTTETTTSPSVGISVSKTLAFGPASFTVGFAHKISGASLQPLAVIGIAQ